MGKLSTIFKALSEPLRLRILRLLLDHGKEIYGGELARALGIPAYQLSRHLKVLRTTGLINGRREGRWVYYSLTETDGDLMRALRQLITQAHLTELPADGHGPATLAGRRGKRGLRRRAAPVKKEEVFNWDQGPAIPGIL